MCRLRSDGDGFAFFDRMFAIDYGEAAGHAFRAAELAYDMGQRHERSSVIVRSLDHGDIDPQAGSRARHD